MSQCQLVDCLIESNGTCRLGRIPVASCENLLAEGTSNINLEDEIPGSDIVELEKSRANFSSRRRPLYSGDALTVMQASSGLSARETKMVTLVGNFDAGKTTLIAELFHSFLFRRNKTLHFAGSKTLMAFERKCFHARIASSLPTPDTMRTSIDEDPFTHLLISHEDRISQLLLCDVSGEAYANLLKSTAYKSSLTYLPRSDHLAILVPCDTLIDKTRRQKALDDAVDLIRRLLQCDLARSPMTLRVIFSKFDLVEESADSVAIESYLKQCEAQFSAQFSRSFSSLMFSRLNARNDDASQIEDMVCQWLSSPAHPAEIVATKFRSMMRWQNRVVLDGQLEGIL